MQEQRLKILEEYFLQDPTDPFNGYALAMEYASVNRPKAMSFLENLYYHHPDYLPTYYHLAQFYFDMDENKKAEEVYLKGIELALKQGDHKAEKELKGAYQIFKDETDEW